MRPWSYSALTLYETCPHAYKLRYVDKIKSASNEHMERGNKIHSSLENFLQADKPLPEEAQSLQTYCEAVKATGPKVEEDWGFDVNWRPTGYFAKDVWCRMKLDAYYITGTTAKIIDWKTGKHYPVKMIDQGQLYALGASLMFPVTRFDIDFVYVDQDQIKPVRYGLKHVEKFKAKFTKRATKLGTDKLFIPKPHKYICKYCPVRGPCTFHVED